MSASEIAWREEERAKFLAKGFVDRSIGRLAAWFPARDWKMPEVTRALTALWAEFGEERAEAAISDTLDFGGLREDGTRNSSFPPTMAEIRNCIPAPRGAFRAPQTNCPDCSGTGWQTLGEGRERRVKRCPCACREGVA